jgi:hypothetical protein
MPPRGEHEQRGQAGRGHHRGEQQAGAEPADRDARRAYGRADREYQCGCQAQREGTPPRRDEVRVRASTGTRVQLADQDPGGKQQDGIHQGTSLSKKMDTSPRDVAGSPLSTATTDPIGTVAARPPQCPTTCDVAL